MRNSERPFYILLIGCLIFGVFITSKYIQAHKELRKTIKNLETRDSLWYAHHEIDSQIQVLLSGNPDSAYILRQIVAESGSFGSKQFQRNRNLFGFHNGNDYLKFPHWRDSYDYFMNRFYCDKKQGESYCDFIRRRKFGSNGVVDYCMEK